jgi:hypothetical protein
MRKSSDGSAFVIGIAAVVGGPGVDGCDLFRGKYDRDSGPASRTSEIRAAIRGWIRNTSTERMKLIYKAMRWGMLTRTPYEGFRA